MRRACSGRDAEAKGRSEGINDINEGAQVTDGFEKMRTHLTCVEGLAEVDVNVGDLVVVLEKSWAASWAAVAEVDPGKMPVQIVTGSATGFLASPSSSS